MSSTGNEQAEVMIAETILSGRLLTKDASEVGGRFTDTILINRIVDVSNA